MKNNNMLLMSDYYKQSHAMMYPEGASYLATYLTPRMSRMPHYQDFLICFGIQGFCQDYLIERFNESFFNRDKEDILAEARYFLSETLNKDYNFVDKMGKLWDLGYLPLRVSALPEGTKCPIYSRDRYGNGRDNPVKVPMVKVENTHPDFAWLAEWVESIMSCQLWYPMTVANQAYYYREIANDAYEKSCDIGARSAISEFGFRGQDGLEGATLASSAFLTSFNKTATIPAILYLRDYYGGDIKDGDTGAGMVSTEHSVMCSNFAVDGDEETFLKRLFAELYPTGAVSVVMDSYDYWANLQRCGNDELKNIILNRNGTVFFRGDSGDPVDIICGKNVKSYKSLKDRLMHRSCDTLIFVEDEQCWYKFRKENGKDHWDRYDDEPVESLGTVGLLWKMFGGTVNNKGYKVLDSHVRAIYGDSITPFRARLIYNRLIEKGFAANNVALGAGSFSMRCAEEDGALLPFTRDSYGIAVKATYMETSDGREFQIFKNPKTDSDNFKKSQKGLVWVGQKEDGTIYAEDGYTRKTMPRDSLLRPVFEDGKMIVKEDINTIRFRLHKGEF